MSFFTRFIDNSMTEKLPQPFAAIFNRMFGGDTQYVNTSYLCQISGRDALWERDLFVTPPSHARWKYV